MEEHNDTMDLLDLIIEPGFYVRDGRITRCNQAASQLFLTAGTSVAELIETGKQEYADFTGGSLYLTLLLAGQPIEASVTRLEGQDVFILDPDRESPELRALALASQKLRGPMNDIMLFSEQLQSLPESPQTTALAAAMRQSLFRLMRILNGMSGAQHRITQQETRDADALFQEIFSKAQTLLEAAGRTLEYTGIGQPIYCLADAQELEQAVLCLISNALKFSPPGSPIRASLTQQGRRLYLRIQDEGPGIPDSLRGTIFRRYLRQPGIEDSRIGIGLGLASVRSAAIHHGGTVLIDQPESSSTRVTVTLAIRQPQSSSVRSPIFRVDYSGGWDQALVELSDSLPRELYK